MPLEPSRDKGASNPVNRLCAGQRSFEVTDSPGTHGAMGQIERRQLRFHVAGEFIVVIADNGNVAGDRKPRIADRIEAPRRHPIVLAENRRGAVRQR